jgi:hypothetical protein
MVTSTSDDPRTPPHTSRHTYDESATLAALPGLARRVSWSAILAGSLLALALQFAFGLLGAGIGFSLIDPTATGDSGPVGIGTIVYTVLSQIISLVAGGFVAARFAGIPRDTSAAMHGVMVWAVSTFAMLYVAATTVASVAGGVTSLIGNTLQGSANAVEAVLPDDLPSIPTPDIAMEDLPPEVRSALEENDVTVEQLREEIRSVYEQVLSERERQQMARTARALARDVASSPADFQEDIDQAIDQLFGQGEPLSNQDRRELVTAIREELGLSEEEADRVLTRIERAADRAARNVREAAETAETEIGEAVDATADRLAATSFLLFVFSVLGLVAALFGGIAGEPKHLAIEDEHHPAS